MFDEERLPYRDVYQHLLPAATTPLSSAWRLQSKALVPSPSESYSPSSTEKADEESQPIMRLNVIQPQVIPAVSANVAQDQRPVETSVSDSSQGVPISAAVPPTGFSKCASPATTTTSC